jgi:hypothetical protein
MGLDVLHYDKDDNYIESYEISETLHNEIFNSKKLWRSYGDTLYFSLASQSFHLSS